MSIHVGTRAPGQSFSGNSPRPILSVTVALVLLVGVIGLVALAFDGWRKFQTMSGANSDSAQRTLSQLEVEFLKFEGTLTGTDEDTSLDRVRTAFDILYNRARILRTAPLYVDGAASAGVRNTLDRIWAEIAWATEVIDGPDSGLRVALPALHERFSGLGTEVREVSLEVSRALARTADAQRQEVARTLGRLASAISAFVVLLTLAFALLAKQNNAIQNRSRELDAAVNRMSAIVSTAMDAVIVADVEGHILEFNAAAEAMFGYARQDVLGSPMSETIVPDHLRAAHDAGMARYRATLERRMVGGGLIQMHAKRKNGELFPIELAIQAAVVPDGEVFVAFLRDISLRKATEAELLRSLDRAEAGEKAKSELLAVMSHEMRTPLNGLLGALDLIHDRPIDPETANLLRLMQISAEILLAHVDIGLEITRMDRGEAEVEAATFDLDLLIADIVDMHRPMAAQRSSTLHASLGHGSGLVVGDRLKLRQVLVNLLSNSVKFTEHGRIRIETARCNDATMVEFRVIDTGEGIEKARLDTIFDVFVTGDPTFGRRVGGTGLGLAITARLVRLLNGSIDLESTPGMGSVFRVLMPLPPASASSGTATSPATRLPAFSGSGHPVLLVEDNQINRIVTQKMLERDGWTVTVAADGYEAVRISAADRFDLILMDISMPGMDGIEAMRSIREEGRSRFSRIVAVTAHASSASVTRLLETGFDAVVTKPLSPRKLAIAMLPDHKEPQRDAAGDTEPLMDEETMRELERALGPGGGRAVWDRLIEQADPIIGRLTEIREGRPGDDRDRDAVHRLAGSAATVGAAGLAHALRSLEGRLADSTHSGAVDEISNVLIVWNRTRTLALELASSGHT